MINSKGAGCFKCHFRIFVKIRNFFIMAGRHTFLHIRVHSPRFLCNYLEFGLAFLGEIRSYMDLFIGTVIGIFGAKSALLRGLKCPNFGQKWQRPYCLLPPCSDLEYANELRDVMRMRG